MRIVVTASDAALWRAAQSRIQAAGRPSADSMERCDIEVSTLTEPTSRSALVRLFASSIQAVPKCPSRYDGALALDAPTALLRQQLEAWERIAFAHDECARRALTAESLGLPEPNKAPLQPIRALFVGPANPLFLALQRSFAVTPGAITATFSSCSGFDHLHDETFDAVILNGADEPQAALSFCAALKRNASLFDLPVMVLVKPTDPTITASAIERGASVLLDVTASADAPMAWLFETIRRERTRRATEIKLRALRDLMGDPRTGLWRSKPFWRHLDRMVGDHQLHHRPMSVAALRLLPAPGSQAPAEAAWRDVCLEVAGLMGRLVREADCVAAIASDQFVIALPLASPTCASRVADRIASVVEFTSFAGGATYRAPVVLEQNIVALRAAESGASLITRALSAFAPEQRSA